MRLVFPEACPLPENPIVPLRGLLGFGLRDHLHPDMAEPPTDSAYWRIFKPAGGLPHPCLLHCAPGEGMALELPFRVVAFGADPRPIHLCAAAFEARERAGFGGGQVPYRLECGPVRDREITVHDGWDRVTGELRLVTPAQLEWRNAPLRPDGPLVHALAWAAARRLRALAEAFDGVAQLPPEWVNEGVARTEVLRAALHHTEARRNSTASGDSIGIGGLVGWVRLRLPQGMATLLSGAQHCGVGKKVFAGNGRVRWQQEPHTKRGLA